MDDADRQQQGANAEDASAPGEVISRYDVVPYAEKNNDDSLYAFRAAIPPPPAPPPPPTPVQQAATARKNILLVAGIGGLAVIFAILITLVVANHQEPAPAFIDLGANSIASAGLDGRLIVKWDGKAEYELHIDPLVPKQIPGFSAVAGNPPRPLSIDFRLKDGFGSALCQKEILIPTDSAAQADPEQAQPLIPIKTTDGDIVQNVAGSDGQIDEIVISGQLPCSVKLYKRLAAWDFVSGFPTVADQENWLRDEQNVEGNLRRRAAEARAKALIPRSRPLSAPIEGDDVIVGDNPSRGTVETKAGRSFFVGKDGLRARASGWQIFPAAIHFRCDIKANCLLTRTGASSALQARLVR